MDTQIQKATQYIIPQYDILDKEKNIGEENMYIYHSRLVILLGRVNAMDSSPPSST